MAKDLRFVFTVMQRPDWRGFSQNYRKMFRMCMYSLFRKGFDRNKVILLTDCEGFADRIRKDLKIKVLVGPEMPKELHPLKDIQQGRQYYCFYKPVALHNCLPDVPDNMVTAWADVDSLFRINPYNFLLSIEQDFWSGVRGRVKKSFGGEALRILQERDGWKSRKRFHAGGLCVVQPHIYKDLIREYYMTSIELAKLADCFSKGDDVSLNIAICKLGITNIGSLGKYICDRRIMQNYGGASKKRMIVDYQSVKRGKFRPV